MVVLPKFKLGWELQFEALLSQINDDHCSAEPLFCLYFLSDPIMLVRIAKLVLPDEPRTPEADLNGEGEVLDEVSDEATIAFLNMQWMPVS